MPPSIPIALSTSCSSPSPSGVGGGRGDAAAATTARRCEAARRGRGGVIDRSEEAVRFPDSVVDATAAAGGGGVRDDEGAAIFFLRSNKAEARSEMKGNKTGMRSATWTRQPQPDSQHATVFRSSGDLYFPLPLRLLGSARFGN